VPGSRQTDRAPHAQLGSLDRGLLVLEMISARAEMSLSALAVEAGTSRTTMFRILDTLRARGWLDHAAESHTYRLGAKALAVAARAPEAELAKLAEPVMVALRRETSETVNLVRIHGIQLVYAAVLEGGYVLRPLPTVGQPTAAHSSALGKVFLAHSPVGRRQALLGRAPYERFTDRTITSPPALDRELAIAKERGFAVDKEETELGLTCVAAAIVGADGNAVGAISVSGLSDRMRRLDLERLGRRLRIQCEQISADLGAARPDQAFLARRRAQPGSKAMVAPTGPGSSPGSRPQKREKRPS